MSHRVDIKRILADPQLRREMMMVERIEES